ncbi:hypothetical protein [Empedobacter brevis]|uniref:hypothetical protein n=1 Tax=Empedobacter brevis TaxID=247 RepID=UPI0039B04B59
MKKNLLTLFVLGAIYSVNAQDTYIKDAVVVKVNTNTLFYNGGNVNVDTDSKSATTEKIINEGNIQIKGGFKNINETGKNFVNRYAVGEDSKHYGQLIIADNATTSVDGKVVMERVKPDQLQNNEYVIALPFKNIKAKDVINSLSNDIFKGDCAVNVNCKDERYAQSLLVWDIAETEYDAVDNNYTIEPYKSYLLNLRPNTNIYNALNALGNASKIGFSGVPSNETYNISNIKSGWAKGKDFSGKKYGAWKNEVNNYNQIYDTYLGNQTTKNDGFLDYGKNLHRFGNPYTSNLDLSNVKKGESWITFNTKGGTLNPTEVYDNAIRFKVFKVSNGFKITWNSENGNTSTGGPSTLFNAYLSKNTTNNTYFWTGSWEALLVKPYETFYISYPGGMNPSESISNNEIVSANLKLTDANKTFSYDFSNVTNNDGLPSGTFERSSFSTQVKPELLNNEELKAKGLVTDFDFTQLELYLTKDNTIQGSAAYLLNANFMKTGATTNANVVDNPVFFYEEDTNGNVLSNAQTTSNSFNNEDYIGKPLRVGFNKLEQGKTYRLNLNLYEYSILNKVNKLNLGKYYLLDKVTGKSIEIDETTEISFTADNKVNDRFEFYWNELPKTLGTNDLSKLNSTYLYKSNNDQFVKFEQTNTTADIIIYDLTGRQLFNKTNISTSTDYKLNLTNVPNVYVVKIVYKDGKTVTKKTINK